MENLTVISGSGERFELRLPEPELLRSAAEALQSSLQQEKRTMGSAVAQILAPFFPPRCREFLAALSKNDVLKLISAFRLLAGPEEPTALAALPEPDKKAPSALTSLTLSTFPPASGELRIAPDLKELSSFSLTPAEPHGREKADRLTFTKSQETEKENISLTPAEPHGREKADRLTFTESQETEKENISLTPAELHGREKADRLTFTKSQETEKEKLSLTLTENKGTEKGKLSLNLPENMQGMGKEESFTVTVAPASSEESKKVIELKEPETAQTPSKEQDSFPETKKKNFVSEERTKLPELPPKESRSPETEAPEEKPGVMKKYILPLLTSLAKGALFALGRKFLPRWILPKAAKGITPVSLPEKSAGVFPVQNEGKPRLPHERSFQEENSPLLPAELKGDPDRAYSDEVIAAAYCYKWHLEYAASLSAELLERCLQIAGVRRKAPEQEFSLSTEELNKALRRNQELRERLKDKKSR